VPLLHGEEAVGVLKVLSKRPRAFDEDTVQVLAPLADFIGSALRRAGDYVVQEQLANRDDLTGLANRRHLLHLLDAALSDGRMTEVTAFYLDLDGFKAVNDQQGHDAGDRLLVDVASRLSAAVREDDVVARLGGDEFVVICRALDEPATRTMTDRLQSAIRDARPFGLRGASIGVARGLPGDVAATLLARADASMYEKKQLSSR
jgi:diguanylate cyclase (GGDEF)-like protein